MNSPRSRSVCTSAPDRLQDVQSTPLDSTMTSNPVLSFFQACHSEPACDAARQRADPLQLPSVPGRFTLREPLLHFPLRVILPRQYWLPPSCDVPGSGAALPPLARHLRGRLQRPLRAPIRRPEAHSLEARRTPLPAPRLPAA